MVRQAPYTVTYAPAVVEHLGAIAAKHHALIKESIEQQLLFEPAVETRNRKPLSEPNAINASWELRFGPENRFRVFYRIDEVQREARVLAVGVKERNTLRIGREVVEL